jgi:lysophospholipase L1-like esterase
VKIYIFGDSICVGQHVDVSETWPSLLSQWLKLEFKGMGRSHVCLSNRSINGNTTWDALGRIQFEVLAHKPDLVFMQFGLNDCNVWDSGNGLERVLPATFRANLGELIERLIAVGVKSIIVNTNHPTTKLQILPRSVPEKTYEGNNSIYNDIIRDVSNHYWGRIEFYDINTKMKDEISADDMQNYLLPDKIHLSALGHKFYFKALRGLFYNKVKHLNVSKTRNINDKNSH